MRRNYQNHVSTHRRVYSEAFKRKVVSDILDGLYSPWRAREIYKIGGNMTIYKWLVRYNPQNVFADQGGKMKKSDKASIVDLKSRVRYLEQIVSDLTIEKKILEVTIDIANETYGLDLKKNIGKALSSESMKRAKRRSLSKD